MLGLATIRGNFATCSCSPYLVRGLPLNSWLWASPPLCILRKHFTLQSFLRRHQPLYRTGYLESKICQISSHYCLSEYFNTECFSSLSRCNNCSQNRVLCNDMLLRPLSRQFHLASWGARFLPTAVALLQDNGRKMCISITVLFAGASMIRGSGCCHNRGVCFSESPLPFAPRPSCTLLGTTTALRETSEAVENHRFPAGLSGVQL